MEKIKMSAPIVEMDGDEMTRVVWRKIKEILICPFVELDTEYYDLGLENRNATRDKITVAAAEAVKKHGVAVKCATITPNSQRVEEYGLERMWKSPNGTIRKILDGTVFREPIIINGVEPLVKCWKKPVIIARHAYGDIYSNAEFYAEQGETAYIIAEKDGKEVRRVPVHSFENGAGVVQGVHNTDGSIRSFARCCMSYALERKIPLWFGAKDTVSKTYDHRFKDIFNEVYFTEYENKFKTAGIDFVYTLIDDAVARVMRSGGGMLWACKNYDGDVMSDMVASAYGSLGMMSSVLVSPDGKYEFEAAHGTVTRHYYAHLKGEETSTNPVATLWAWTGALKKRGEIDKNKELCAFAEKLESATLATIESGFMTGDLVPLFNREGIAPVKLTTTQFLQKIAQRL